MTTTKTSRRARLTVSPDTAPPVGSDPRQANVPPAPIRAALGAPTSRSAVPATVPNDVSPDGPSPAANEPAKPILCAPQGTKTTERHVPSDAHGMDALGTNVPDPAATAESMSLPSTLLDPALCLAADVLDDLERVRIANENRLRQLTRVGEDADGEERGFGLSDDHPDVLRLSVMVETLAKVEHDATLNLQRKMRKHPLGAWVKAQRGVGEKQGARLLAAIGDPYINSAKGAPRTVSALWAYCGLHVLPVDQGLRDARPPSVDRNQLPEGHGFGDSHVDPAVGGQCRDTDQPATDARGPGVGVAAKRRRGERANWSTNAKMRAYLIAESCIKQLSPDCRGGHSLNDDQMPAAAPACNCSPYRVAYDRRRAHTAVTHPEWTDGHSHNDALRVASKEILKDLWRAARDWHLAADGAS